VKTEYTEVSIIRQLHRIEQGEPAGEKLEI